MLLHSSIVAQLIKNPLALQFDSWVRKNLWRRDRLPTPVFLGSLVAQLVKNLPAMWETWVWSLGWEDPLEKGKATHSSILVQRMYSFRILAPRMSQPCLLNWWCKQSIGTAAPFHTPLILALDVSGTHQHAADSQSWNPSGPGTAVSPSEVFSLASHHILESGNV